MAATVPRPSRDSQYRSRQPGRRRGGRAPPMVRLVL